MLTWYKLKYNFSFLLKKSRGIHCVYFDEIYRYSRGSLKWNFTQIGKTDVGSMDRDMFSYVVGSKSFRPDIQKPRQMENAVRDI